MVSSQFVVTTLIPLLFPASVVLFLGLFEFRSLFAFLVPFIAPLAAVFVILAAVFNLTTIASYAQFGSLQERLAPWSVTTRPKQSKGQPSGPVATLEERVSYTLSIANFAVTIWLAGVAPQHFHLWYTPKVLVLTFLRWLEFRRVKQHYLLYDFCYWANALVIVYIWFFPQNPRVFQMVFLISNGPLAFAVLAFSHSLIFHSVPHTTSLVIHTSPAIMTHLVRWGAAGAAFAACDSSDCNDVSPRNMVWRAFFLFYVPWVIFYYIWIYCVFADRVRNRGYQTLFDRVVKKGFVGMLIRQSGGIHTQRMVYLATHCLYTLFVLCCAALFCLFMTAAWNGAGFYTTYMQTVHLSGATCEKPHAVTAGGGSGRARAGTAGGGQSPKASSVAAAGTAATGKGAGASSPSPKAKGAAAASPKAAVDASVGAKAASAAGAIVPADGKTATSTDSDAKAGGKGRKSKGSHSGAPSPTAVGGKTPASPTTSPAAMPGSPTIGGTADPAGSPTGGGPSPKRKGKAEGDASPKQKQTPALPKKQQPQQPQQQSPKARKQ